jgi:limonene-1,2-epoxide hydrolase
MATTSTASPSTTTTAPADVVRSVLLALQAGELDSALELLADDVRYINVSLPTVRGRERVERLFRPAYARGGRFRVHFHAIATDGDVVLTDRTDALGIGRFEQRLWVYGRFVVKDGKITLWRDSFDWLDVTLSALRGLLAIAIPALNRPWPGGD